MDHNQQEEIDILYKNSLLPTCNINGLLVTDLLNVEEEIKCYTITDEKEKFYPMTKVKNIDLTLIKIPYMNILFLLMLFILSSNQSKLFILNKKFNL